MIKEIKLHLGCGKRNFGNDWIHIDGENYPHISSNDIINLNYNNEVDLIYISHVIEYFDREEIIPILKKWNEALKVGGILRIAVPDFEAMSRLYLDKKFELKSFLGPLYGKMKMGDDYIYHKTVYDFESLKEILIKSEFSSVEKYNWRLTEHSEFDDCSQAYLPHMDKENGTLISLNIEAIK